ncbi:IclR family transcriptional regulator [Streptomyces sp. NPDC090106]|uniref:IclR family transcriptional regulator n=1 Tax=Streptomyces sp. NPDC090106 TaxID=3365946 RepID=UPI0037FE8908
MVKSDVKGTGPVTLQTVERAFSFLEAVASSEEQMTVRDVAQRLGLNITTAYHLFNTLTAAGYVTRRSDLTLHIGPKAALLYDGYLRGVSPQEHMNDVAQGLAAATRETAWVATLINGSVVVTAYTEGPQAVRASGQYIGLSGDEHVRSAGQAVLAYLGDDRREQVLSRSLADLDPAEAVGVRAELSKTLSVVRERGWAIDDETYVAGAVGIAAPYFAGLENVAGAVGIWAPAMRAHDNLDALVKQAVQAAMKASGIFGT